MVKKEKSGIRKEIKERLNQLSTKQRLQKSRLIKEQLFALAEFKKARYVMFYLADDEEVQTDTMIKAAQKIGKKILVPVVSRRERRIKASLVEQFDRELTVGPYKIRQPQRKYMREIPNEKIDLVVIPGRAFDRQGHRLGRGGGYYDKFLAALPRRTPRIGLAFDFQICKRLPLLSHDISVTKVISA